MSDVEGTFGQPYEHYLSLPAVPCIAAVGRIKDISNIPFQHLPNNPDYTEIVHHVGASSVMGAKGHAVVIQSLSLC